MHAASPRRSWPPATPPPASSTSPGTPSKSRPQGRRSVTGPLVTVVVLNYNGAERIPGVLRSLAAQDLPDGQVAVWVVDNASADGSLELLARDFPLARTIARPTNDGFAGDNNLPLREVATPFVALLNNDEYPAPDWLRRLLEPFQRTDAQRLAATTPQLVFLPRFL